METTNCLVLCIGILTIISVVFVAVEHNSLAIFMDGSLQTRQNKAFLAWLSFVLVAKDKGFETIID